MSPMALLLVLLVLAYIGSLWAKTGRRRAFGSPSGIEYVVLGALLGPEVLDALSHEAMTAFEPIALVALGWLGLIFGLECGMVGERRAPLGRMSLGLFFSVVTAGTVGYVCYLLASSLHVEHQLSIWLSCALALVSVETTRHALQWISEEHMLSGSLAGLVLDLEAADDAPVLVALATLFALLSGQHEIFGQQVAPLSLAVVTIGSGMLLGGVSGWLIAKASSPVERWTILLGSVWLVSGMARSLGLSAIAATFTLGATLSAFSREAGNLREKLGHTEGAVLLPALLLAGAHVARPESELEVMLIGSALGLRVLLSFLFGLGLSYKRPETRGLGLWIGAGMLAPGSLTVLVGFAMTLRCPPEIARPALTLACVGTLLGELIGPRALKQILQRFTSAPRSPPPPRPSLEPGS